MQKTWPINQFLIFITTISILFVIMKFSAELLSPFLISVGIAIVLSPLLTYLRDRKIPKIVSLILIIILSATPIIMIGNHIMEDASQLTDNIDTMKDKMHTTVDVITIKLNSMGMGVTRKDIETVLKKSNIMGIIKKLSSQVNKQFSNIFLIFFTVAFMLMESEYLHNKLKKALSSSEIDLKDGMEIIAKIKKYFIIKVKTSLMTAIWALIVLWYFDISYYYIWATLAFFLNFIPVIGSIFAAVPPIIIALMDQGSGTAMWVMLWYAIINNVVGNIIEPRIMGKGLGLSALVIFLSMTLWGWVLGPTGMILSVPLTMAMQFLFEQYEETKWISLMLSDYKKDN
jgi:predicted PurR-regulated permease PerM